MMSRLSVNRSIGLSRSAKVNSLLNRKTNLLVGFVFVLLSLSAILFFSFISPTNNSTLAAETTRHRVKSLFVSCQRIELAHMAKAIAPYKRLSS